MEMLCACLNDALKETLWPTVARIRDFEGQLTGDEISRTQYNKLGAALETCLRELASTVLNSPSEKCVFSDLANDGSGSGPHMEVEALAHVLSILSHLSGNTTTVFDSVALFVPSDAVCSVYGGYRAAIEKVGLESLLSFATQERTDIPPAVFRHVLHTHTEFMRMAAEGKYHYVCLLYGDPI